MTLVEMIVAIAVTAILAVCLSYVMTPVMNTYSLNQKKAELADFATKTMNRIAADLRGAYGVYVTTNKYSSCSYNGSGDVASRKNVEYSYLIYGGYKNDKSLYMTRCDVSNYKRKIFSLPHIAEDFASMSDGDFKKEFDFIKELEPSGYGHAAINFYTHKKPSSQTNGISVAGEEGFYVLVRKNPDNGNIGNALEIHLKLKKGKVSYEAVKTLVCENLVIRSEWIKTADLYNNKNAVASSGSSNTKYYSVWFSRVKDPYS